MPGINNKESYIRPKSEGSYDLLPDQLLPHRSVTLHSTDNETTLYTSKKNSLAASPTKDTTITGMLRTEKPLLLSDSKGTEEIEPKPQSTQESAIKAAAEEASVTKEVIIPATAAGSKYALYFSPFLTTAHVVDNEADSLKTSGVDQKPGLGFEAGFRAHRQLSPRLTMALGLHASSLRQTASYSAFTGKIDTIDVLHTDTTTHYTTKRQAEQWDLKYNLMYVGTSVGADYQVLQKPKSAVFLTAGVQAKYLISGRTTVYRNEATTDEAVYSLNKFSSNLLLGVRYEAWLTPRIGLQIGPSLQYNFTSVFKSQSPVSNRPFSVELSLGITFTGKK